MITSVRNPQIQRARKLARSGLRERAGEFLVEGPNAVSEAVATGHRPLAVFVTRGFKELPVAPDIEVYEVSDAVMKAISGASTPPGIIAICRFIDVAVAELLKRSLQLVLVVDEVRDPGNVGTIIRTSVAAGADAVFVSRGSADIYNPKVVRSTAGAMFRLPICRGADAVDLVDAVKSAGLKVVATSAKAQTPYHEVDMTGPTAIVVGNEASGVSPDVENRADAAAALPMARGAESLNVAIAAAVFLFEAGRQRRSRSIG